MCSVGAIVMIDHVVSVDVDSATEVAPEETGAKCVAPVDSGWARWVDVTSVINILHSDLWSAVEGSLYFGCPTGSYPPSLVNATMSSETAFILDIVFEMSVIGPVSVCVSNKTLA